MCQPLPGHWDTAVNKTEKVLLSEGLYYIWGGAGARCKKSVNKQVNKYYTK